MSYPQGGEEVVLTNLTPDGVTRFRLPKLNVPVVVVPAADREQEVETRIDTMLIEPDKRRFMLTWRATLPMKRSCFDIQQAIVGEDLRSVRRARGAGGKKRYADLDEMIRDKKAQVGSE